MPPNSKRPRLATALIVPVVTIAACAPGPTAQLSRDAARAYVRAEFLRAGTSASIAPTSPAYVLQQPTVRRDLLNLSYAFGYNVGLALFRGR